MREIRGLTVLLAAFLATSAAGCKDKAPPPEPAQLGPLDSSEFTGKCKEILEHVVKVSTAADMPAIDQIKIRVAGKVDAKRCQKGAMPDEEQACMMAAKNKAEVEACRPKK
ncbi:MAG: hypothetical protein U0359_42110 [Byssovorax sp.]